MSQAAIIVNTRSGGGRGRGHELSRRLAERLRGRGIEARSIAFDAHGDGPGSWRQRLDDAIAAGAGRVYVLGGDGTVLAVAGALLGRDVALGIVPLGTANLLARDLGMPTDPARAADALADTEVRRIDVGRVNGEPFLCASMMGLTTTLARAREAARGHGALKLWPRLVRKTVWLLRRYPYQRVTLELGGSRLTLRSRAMVIANNPFLPEAGLYPRRGRLDSGALGIYGVREGPVWELPRVVLRLLNGTWPDEPRIFHHDAARLTVQAPPSRGQGERITVLNDGERLRLTPPLRYEVLPRALPVLIPTTRRRPAAAPAVPESEPNEHTR
jgi:diacylglycerol kinase family enzyme